METQPIPTVEKVVAFQDWDRDIFGDFVSVLVFRHASNTNGPLSRAYAKLEWIEVEEHAHVSPSPTFRLLRQDAVKLMDELWKIGVRPTDIGTPGHLSATQRHLEDFRAIVSKQLGVEFKV